MTTIRLCDQCLLCKYWSAEVLDSRGSCNRYPQTAMTDSFYVCGEFQWDALRDTIETSKVMTLLESGAKKE